MVQIDFVRIKSNRLVPPTNRLSLDVLDMDGTTGCYADLTFNSNECELHMPYLTN